MYGAILGDMIGAPYEFDRGNKTKDFPLFSRGSQFTDDSVMTIAVAEALMSLKGEADDEAVHHAVSKAMRIWGRNYPDAGYGGRFRDWLFTHWQPKPYGSWGNGSAMRVSSVGWLYDTIEETRRFAKLTAEVTHNHPEGIKGAEATASAIFMARTGAAKDEIREYIIQEFGYDLSRTCDEIRPEYHHVESCQETVPEAITAFLEGNDFEDVIRTAVSLGGDCDTLTCIAGAIAEAFYGVPEAMKEECRKRLPKDMLTVLDNFEQMIADKNPPFHDSFLDGNELIDEAIERFYADGSKDNLIAVLDAIRQRMHADGHFIFPVIMDEEDENRFSFQAIQTKDGKLWNAAFTSQAEFEKGAPSRVVSNFIDSSMKFCLESETEGFIINPWGQSFMLAKELIEMIFKADGDVEYSVPDDPITPELLEDGTFLKRATEICNRNRTQLNLIKLARILRDSWVWVPCTAIFSEADTEAMNKVVLEAADNNDLDSLVGHTFTSHDEVRMVPDILQNGDDFFFPVFSSDQEMGEYGQQFSKVQRHFLEAANLARNNEKNVKGIVINAFSEPFVIPKELFDVIAGMKSSIERGGYQTMSEKYSKADLRHIAEDMIEDLRECEDGTVTTTGRLARDYGYDDMETFDLFDLHDALFRAAKANKITLDMSEHEGKVEGLPFNLTFVVKNKKAQIKCPRCGSTDTARYIYGYPAFSEEMQKRLDEGKWVLGGCCISSVDVNGVPVRTMPARHCNKCKKDFASAPILITPKKDLAEDYRDIVTSIKFSVGGFFEGNTEVTISKNDEGAVVKVMQFPYGIEAPDDRQITPAKWNKIVNILYGHLYLHEWKKEFVDPCVLDGTQWELDIKLTNRRVRHYYGSNDYPPYWSELKKIFREFAKL